MELNDRDFSHVPYRGRSTRPNDFFSYFITEEDAKTQEYIITLHRADIPKVESFVSEIICQLPAMGDMTSYLVGLKVGVNTRDIIDAIEDRHGSFGSNRRAELA